MNDRRRIALHYLRSRLLRLKDSLIDIDDGICELYDGEANSFDKMLKHQQKSAQGNKSLAAIQEMQTARCELTNALASIDVAMIVLKDATK